MNKITLYHYSYRDFHGYIRPKYFGLNSYSNNSIRVSVVNRSYFYLKEGIKECHLSGCEFLYTAEIDKDKLYDLDSKTILSDDIYAEVKKRGYKGLYNKEQAVIFKSVKIKEKIDLLSRRKR